MGKLGRFACILTPMLCTLASLVATVLLLIGGTKTNLLPSMYQFRLDVRRINLQGSLDVIPGALNVNISTGVTQANAQELGLSDFYTSHMWNYCSGNVTSGGSWGIQRCTAAKSGYTFDVESIVDAESTREITFPDSVKKVQKGINIIQKIMAACYVLGAVSTGACFIVGWFGLLSRWGSCITTIIADAAFLFILAGSICSTALSYSLKSAFNKAFDSFGVSCTIGSQWQSATWAATVFALAASVFWMMSTCCCSGRTSKVMGQREPKGKGAMKAERNPYTYERVASPYIGQTGGETHQNVPMQPFGAHHKQGFEPMRHGQV